MPVRREDRNVVASPEELNRWLQRTSGRGCRCSCGYARFRSHQRLARLCRRTEGDQEFFTSIQPRTRFSAAPMSFAVPETPSKTPSLKNHSRRTPLRAWLEKGFFSVKSSGFSRRTLRAIQTWRGRLRGYDAFHQQTAGSGNTCPNMRTVRRGSY